MKTTNDQNQTPESLYEQLAIDTIKLGAITRKVAAVRAEFAQKSVRNQGVVRSMGGFRMALRIAAAVVLILGSVTIYKYTTVSSQSLYNQQFTDYELSTTRGNSITDVQDEAFRNKNWQKVIAINNELSAPSNKTRFLAAMAEMKLKQFPEAINLLQTNLANSGDKAYREESEYYSVLAYIASNQENKAIDMIAEIKSNPEHTYYMQAMKISAIDLKIVYLKGK